MCRAPTVLTADHCQFPAVYIIAGSFEANLDNFYLIANVDWALLNFMQDWFPVESKAKLKYNRREAAEEELQELGLSTPECIIV